MLGLPERIIVFDTEITTWEGTLERQWSGPGEHKEIVQIAAILIRTDASDFLEEDVFEILIKPKKNPILSDYFIKLTGITQKEVDQKGIDFSPALQKFYEWSNLHPLYSFGDDSIELAENCDFYNIEFPFERSRFFDMRDVFQKHNIKAEDYTSGTIIKAFGKKTTRRAHDAFNDVKTIIDGLRELKKWVKKIETEKELR